MTEIPAETEPSATDNPKETEPSATEIPDSRAPSASPAPVKAEETEPPAVETAPAETPETYVPVPAPVTEPDEDSLIGQPILFRAGDVTIYAESLHRTDSGLEFQASLFNGGGETATWTFASVTLDGNTLKVNDACEIPAGHTILYTYTLNNPLVGLLIRSGDHTVSVHSVLTGADGTLIGEGDSDTVTITVQ